jgi:tetratricopeptide (TPR) repeat protein
VRQYARDRLLEAGEAEAMRRRHRDWFLELAERAEPGLQGREQAVWLKRLEGEHDNLRAALAWSLGGASDPDLGLRLAGALRVFWSVRGHWQEGREWLAAALAQTGPTVSAVERAKALSGAGDLAWYQGDYEGAVVLWQESLAISRELDDKPGIAWSVLSMGQVARLHGEHERANARFEESLSLFQELGIKLGVALSLNYLGFVAADQREYERAVTRCNESLALFRELGDKRGIGFSLWTLGRVASEQGEYERAVSLLEEKLAVDRELDNRWGVAESFLHLGFVASDQGEHERAAELYEESLALFRELGRTSGVAWSLSGLGSVALHQQEYARAATLLKESLALFRELGDKPGIGTRGGLADCLERLARVAVAEGQPERAARLLGAAEALRDALGAPLPPADGAEYQRDVTVIRAGLGEEAFAAAWAAGRAMSLEEAVTVALQEPRASLPS